MTVTTRKIPALRFPEFNGEWEEKRLGKDINLISGQHLSPSEYNNDEDGVPYFTGPSDFTNNANCLTKWTQKSTKIAITNDVLLTVKGSGVGSLMFLKLPEVAMGRQLMAVRAKGAIASFLYQILSMKTQHFEKLATGNMIPGISRDDIIQTKVVLPTLPEQQKIATFLTTIDTRIQQLSRKKELLEKYKKGVIQQLFSQKIRFKDEDEKEFPEWEEKQLGAVFTFCQTNSLSRSLLNYERGAVKNIHYGDIHTKFSTIFDLSKEEVPFINESVDLSKIADENYCKVGDLIIADASEDYKDVGKAIEVVNLAGQTLLAGLHTLIVRDVKNRTVTGFKCYMMQTYKVRQQIMRLATGISVLGISKGNLSKVKLLLPSPPEQQKIAAFLSTLDRQINLVSQQLNQMQTFKKGLLQQMFV